MRVNEKYEKELDLRDLLFNILYHWRSILLVALCTAVLLGGMQFLSKEEIKVGEDTSANIDEIEYYNRQKIHLENEIERYTELKKKYQKYLDESLLMKIDAMNMFSSKKSYYLRIDRDSVDEQSKEDLYNLADSVLQVYSYAMEQNMDEQEMLEAFGSAEIAYIREIAEIEIDSKKNQLTITVHAETSEKAEKGRNYIEKRIKMLEAKARRIASHTLEIVGEVTYPDSDPVIVKKQQNHITDYNVANNDYEEAIGRYNELKEPTTVKKTSSQSNMIISKAIIGFAIGFLIALLIILFSYLMSGKLHSGWELAQQYMVPVIGEMHQSRAWRKGKGIDKMIEALEFRGNQRTDASVYQNIGSLLYNWEEAKKIELVSTLPKDDIKDAQNQLQKRLDGREITLSADFLNNMEAIESVFKADVVLIIEKKYKTRTNDMTQMVVMLQISKVKVIGAIVL